jgi:L-seryl-tRNA(Ser) seleniumtransferase
MSIVHGSNSQTTSRFRQLPAVDRLLKNEIVMSLAMRHGRAETTRVVREILDEMRAALMAGEPVLHADENAAARAVATRLEAAAQPALRRVFNLTGTVLHTNLGRAPLPAEAIEAIVMAAAEPCNLEFELEDGGRGDRDALVEALLCRLTGAEAATVVNNNAAAVFLMLNTLAIGREAVISRGELIEIGGAFRIPDIMARAGCRMVEVGTTNRTHPRDYEAACGPDTALLLKVHTSNYAIEGFTASVPGSRVAEIAHARNLPCIVDLGSGTLVDLARYGLPHEPLPQEALAEGADLVSFSGDKLLGGPQAGVIVGRKDLVVQIKKNPLKRCLRVGKLTLAALEPVLRLYLDPDRLAERLPALRQLTRPQGEIAALADRLVSPVRDALGEAWRVEVVPMKSQIGSGSLPIDRLSSAGLVLRARDGRSGSALERLAAVWRELPVPVLGRIVDDSLQFDLRCLDDTDAFLAQLGELRVA